MPQRDYHTWAIDPDVGEQLGAALGQAVYGDLAEGEVHAAVEAIGKRELAFLLSGAESTRDRAYKSQRDKIQRWIRGVQRPNAAGQRAMQGIAREWRNSQLRGRSAMRVSIVATITVSRKTWNRGKIDATLTGSDLGDFVDALERQDAMEAVQIACDVYGLEPDMVASLDALHSIDIT